MAQVFINPLEDHGFKILFRKKRIMVGFLEAILDRKIEDLDYIDTEQLGVTIDENKSRFDLAVRFADGTDCVVEMQRACLTYFNYRAVFYSSHLIQKQAAEEHDRQFKERKGFGKRACWNYYYRPVYFVGILENGWGDFHGEAGPLVEHYRLRETNSGEDMKVDYNFIFLRLDRFEKREEECDSIIERFAYSLKNMAKEDSKPASFSDELIMNLYDEALVANLSSDLAHELLLSGVMTTENDWLVAINEAEERATRRGLEKGMEEGMEKGMEKGMEEGMEKGIEKGMEKGIEKGMEMAEEATKRLIASNLKRSGCSLDIIVSCVGLPKDLIQDL